MGWRGVGVEGQEVRQMEFGSVQLNSTNCLYGLKIP